jgi:hypothetical protein
MSSTVKKVMRQVDLLKRHLNKVARKLAVQKKGKKRKARRAKR